MKVGERLVIITKAKADGTYADWAIQGKQAEPYFCNLHWYNERRDIHYFVATFSVRLVFMLQFRYKKKVSHMLQKTKPQGSTLLIHSVQHPVKGLKFVFSFKSPMANNFYSNWAGDTTFLRALTVILESLKESRNIGLFEVDQSIFFGASTKIWIW